MYYYLVPLLRKRRDKIILHVGTNNAPRIKADEMLEQLGKLKSLIWEMLPSVKIILSAPTKRVDKYIANENKIDFIKLPETNDSLLINTRILKKTIWIDMASILTTMAPESLLKILSYVHKSTDMIRIPSRKISPTQIL